MESYQEGVAKNEVNKLPVTAHICKYTTQVSIFPSFLKISRKPLHGRPDPAALLPRMDVGTQPGTTSIYHLWKAFDINVDGACGEIVALKGKWGRHPVNTLVA
ncbi:hypothetical protein H0H92_000604, partial [Tricholoma furcatifolium]